MEQPAHEGAGADDDGAGVELEAHVGAQAGDAVAGDEEFGDVALVEVEVGGAFEHGLHAELIGLLVGLSAGGTDAGAFGAVEHSELDGGGVGIEAHRAAEGVYFADDVSLGQTTDGRVAGHLGNGVQVLREHSRPATHAGGGKGGFHAGMASPDDDDVVGHGVEVVRHFNRRAQRKQSWEVPCGTRREIEGDLNRRKQRKQRGERKMGARSERCLF